MKIGSDNSIYGLLTPQTRRGPSIADLKPDAILQPRMNAPSLPSDARLIADFQDRLAKQQLDWTDTDKDGKVTKDEYMDGQQRLAHVDGRSFDRAQAEKHWATLDQTGKGSLNKVELEDGLRRLLPVSAGHLDSNYAERLRSGKR